MTRPSPAVVQVFARAPIPGRVKTRLHPALSPAQAAGLHARLLVHTLSHVMASGLTVQLWGDADNSELRAISDRHHVDFFSQQSGDLGERMRHAASCGLRHFDAVIIVGSDCPALDADYLHAATQALRRSDVVLGPATDGGYVLIGLHQADPRIFDRVDWGSADVLDRTRRNLAAASLSWTELPSRADIDRPEDLLWARTQWPGLFEGPGLFD